MKNTVMRLGAGSAAVLLVAAGAVSGSAFAAPAPETLLITLTAEDAKKAAAAADELGALDIVSATDGSVVVLGDDSLVTDLTDAGIDIEAETGYGTSLGGTPRTAGAQAATASAADIPLPQKLAGKSYETFFGGYRTTAAFAQYARDLAAAYPEMVEVVDYGDTWLKEQGTGGHDLLAVRITADLASQPKPDGTQEGKPRFFLGAQTHSREIITSEIAWRFAADVLDGYGTDAQTTSLLDSTEVWIGFQHNPDSTDVVEEALNDPSMPVSAAGDAAPPAASKAWQRKNQNDSGFEPAPGQGWARHQPGIDLNRNWAYEWGGASTSPNPGSLLYRGQAPVSEPEVKALGGLLTDLYGTYEVKQTTKAPQDRTGTYIHLHAYSNLVLHPYGFDRTAEVPNADALVTSAFRQSAHNDFETGAPGDVLYDASGGDFDWVYGTLGVPGFVYEIGTQEQGGFFPGYSRAADYWGMVKPGLRFAAEAAYEPYRASQGGVVTELSATRAADGSITVAGTATDDSYGAGPQSADRRPQVGVISDVEVAAALDRTALDAGQAQRVSGSTVAEAGVTVPFAATLPRSGTEKAGFVFARAKNASGEFGPWQAVFVDPADTEPSPDPSAEPSANPTAEPSGEPTADPTAEPSASSSPEGREDDSETDERTEQPRDDRRALPRTGAGLWPLAAGAGLLLVGSIGVWAARRRS